MKNYFIKYANQFIFIGLVLLAMYYFDLTPHKLRNAPDELRLGGPIVFIIIGVLSKFIRKEESQDSEVDSE